MIQELGIVSIFLMLLIFLIGFILSETTGEDFFPYTLIGVVIASLIYVIGLMITMF